MNGSALPHLSDPRPRQQMGSAGPDARTPDPHHPALALQLTADERQILDSSKDSRRQFEAADRAIGEAAVWGMAGGAGKAAAAAALGGQK